ncbi:MAG: phosphatidate cytidylyltransferase [Verrucomicrobia bacterium]|nr:phosphatidate cytidylyltransferase [Verrucomicrobiota bacterium]MBU6446937.1 phosphatidate cytidylyltransferase [Verrucomicrobiota bacterium]MDE3048178.1 phosphatidate cytidylyltransferase [Verrucomicrobiota bacterium]
MTDLYRRLIASSITIVLLICLIAFAFNSVFQYIVAAFVALLAGVAIWEYEQFVKAKGGRMILPALIILSVIEVFSFFLSAKVDGLEHMPIIFFFVAFLVLFALHFGQREGAIVDLAVSSFGLLYIAVPMGMVLGILYLSGVDGRWWLTYLLVVTKITDVGAYFGGNLWGKRKLAPTISPKKTVEGAIIGLVCALGASFIFHLASDFSGAFHLGMLEWLFLGLVLGIVGQFGDLSESLLKRDANKKDSNALPGLGGALDAVDSILFNAPIIYIYLHFVKV